MRFETYIPCVALKPYIKQFVIAEQAESLPYKVLPGASLVAGFQYRGKLNIIMNEKPEALAKAGITGLMDKYKLFLNSENIGTVLVYFTETGASHFFKIPLNELFSQSISLDSIIPASTIKIILERLANADNDIKRIAIIEQFFISQLNPDIHDKLVEEAIRLIKTSAGTIRISDLASQLCISQSRLEKRFRIIVGATPKKFASITRLHHLIENKGQNLTMTELGYTAGYFDQSHFIKDFRNFTGETPESFFLGNIK